MSEVQGLSPDVTMMRDHLNFLFGNQTSGRVEIAWTNTAPPYALSHGETFSVHELDKAAQRAADLNAQPWCNVYVGAALRSDDTPPFGRCSDDDAEALTAAYCDLDDPGAADAAAEKAYNTGTWPTAVVYTGKTPHTRAQLYYRLYEPLSDRKAWRSILKACCRYTSGDPSVVNPGRVLRLGGSVAWAVKDGRVHEMTRFVRPKNGKAWNLTALADAVGYDRDIDGNDAAVGDNRLKEAPISVSEVPGENAFGLPREVIDDGREGYMADMVNAAFITFVGKNGCVPTVDELVKDVWPWYSNEVNLKRAGRGLSEVRAKCRYIIDRFERGEHTKYKTLDDVIAAYASRPTNGGGGEYTTDDFNGDGGQQQGPQPSRLRSVDFTTLYNENAVEEPDYIEDGFAGPGNFVLIAGPPKAQKSFLLQELLVSCALGRPFLCDTFNVPRPLRVYYLQAEMNRKLLRKRAKAMKGLTDADLDKLSTNLLASERFQMLLDESGVAAVVAEIKAVYGDTPPDIIAIDPFANVYDGESENDNAQIMRFLVTRVERVRQAVNPAAAIVMVHHATKAKAEDMARDPFVLIRGAGALRGYYDSAIVIFRKNEETKTRKVHFELRSGESPEPMEVELHEGVFVKTSALTGVSMETSRAILKAMDRAFRNNEPWNDNKEAARHGRGAFENMVKFGITRDAAAILLNGWVDNDIVKLRERASVGHALKRPAGYEVIGYL